MSFLINALRRRLGRDPGLEGLDPQGPRGVRMRGHREYVGGHWDEIGQLQFDFLVAQGLRPQHVLLDIACGALRLGVKAIPYLEPGHYLGIEKERSLIRAGLEQELPPELRRQKRPRLLCDGRFRFWRFRQPLDVAIAQSLFTHLPPDLIGLCLQRLRPCLKPGGVFYATFHQVAEERLNPAVPHDHGYFAYTGRQMEAFGRQQGFQPQIIGDWGHPRGQRMIAYRPD